ncbi:MAG: hypothetical protein MK078_04310 [Crocinitomicaceae bacterium]|nr:hypothetical protein [Crocinitomicaceae bacterium]
MTEVQKERIKSLLEDPFEYNVDHLLILESLYWEFKEGNEDLKPLAQFYINGMDDLPKLEQRDIWNEKRFNESRILFTNNFEVLKTLVHSLLKKELKF